MIIEIRGKSKPPAPPPRSVTTRLTTEPKQIRRSSAGDALDCLIYEKSVTDVTTIPNDVTRIPNDVSRIPNDVTLIQNESTSIQDVVTQNSVTPVHHGVTPGHHGVTSVHHGVTPIRKAVSSVQNNMTTAATKKDVKLNRTNVTLNRTGVTLNRTNVTLNRTDVAVNRTGVTLNRTDVAPARPPKSIQLKKVKFHPQVDVSNNNDSKFVDVNLGSDVGSLKPLDPNFIHFLPKLDRNGSDHKSGISYFEPYL